MAAFLHSHGLESQSECLVVCPVFAGLAYLIGNLGLCVLLLIYGYSLSLLPIFPWGGMLLSSLAFPCLTCLTYVVLLHYRNVDTVQRQVRNFTVRDSSSACCDANHINPITGERMICDRSIILRCISEWFGSTDHFESVVRGRLRDALVEELANRTFTYWRIVQATCPVLWILLDIVTYNMLTYNMIEATNIILSILLYWLIVLPNTVLAVLRLAYMAKLVCDGRFTRALIAIGLVAIGALMFGTCFAGQQIFLPFVLREYMDPTLAWVLSTVLFICILGPSSILLWRHVTEIHSDLPSACSSG